MSRRPSPIDPSAAAQPPLSRLAVASLAVSAVVCCPPASVIGIGLAMTALVRIARSPIALRGRSIAIAALVVGTVGLIVQLVALQRFEESYRGALERAIIAEIDTTLAAAIGGDVDLVRRQLEDRAAGRDDDALRRFGAALETRYGGFRNATIVRRTSSGSVTRPALTVALTLAFEQRSVVGAAEFALVPGGSSIHPTPVLRWLEIEDSVHGDLRVP